MNFVTFEVVNIVSKKSTDLVYLFLSLTIIFLHLQYLATVTGHNGGFQSTQEREGPAETKFR